MIILFPSYPRDKKRIDPGFEAEERAAREAGFKTAFVDMGFVSIPELGSGEMQFHRLPDDVDSETFLYRGWLLRPNVYARLEATLFHKQGFRMITTLAGYLEAHDFPKWYQKLEGHRHGNAGRTPHSIYFEGATSDFNVQVISHLVEHEFGNVAVIVKDWIKSRKHEWYDACFIGDASDSAEVQRVVTNFIKGQGDDFAGGLVFREFVEFERAGVHVKSRMPLIKEWRVFVWEGTPFYTAPYWSDDVLFGDQYGPAISLDDPWLLEVAAKIASPFFVLDVAKRLDGTKMVVEVNDGGTAGIPEGVSAKVFYAALASMLHSDDAKPPLAIGQHVRVQIPGSFDNWRNFEIVKLPPEVTLVHLKDLTEGYTTPYCVHPDFVVPITPEQEAQRLIIYAAWKANPKSVKRLRFPLGAS